MLSRKEIYRDSKIWYSTLNEKEGVSKNLLNFVEQYAGKRVLDFGCATGSYCVELNKNGFECFGVDVNENYVNIARKKGVNAYIIKERLPFDDDCFDTVIMLELLEHLENPETALTEAQRVARKNILITVPDCSALELLRTSGLIYEHFLELDHLNFFTKKSIENLLSKKFEKFKVEQNEPIFLWKAELPRWASKLLALLYKLKLFKIKIFNRLYIIIDVMEG